MGEPRIMVAVDPDALNALREELAALRNEIRSVRMEPRAEWLAASEYAKSRGVTRRTVLNWVSRGEVDSRREGSKLFVRANPGA